MLTHAEPAHARVELDVHPHPAAQRLVEEGPGPDRNVGVGPGGARCLAPVGAEDQDRRGDRRLAQLFDLGDRGHPSHDAPACSAARATGTAPWP